MNKKYYIFLAAIIIVAALVYFITRQTISPKADDEQMAVTCSGKTVFRYRNPSEIFPVIIRDYATNFSIASGVLNQLVVDSSGGSSVSTDVKNNAKQLRDQLNQDNIFFENTLKAYFLASNNDPCNDSLRYMYTAYIKEMTEKVIELKQFVNQVSTEVPATSTSEPFPPEEVAAVIDTANNKVTAPAPNLPGEIVVLKNDIKLNAAMEKLQNKYEVSKTRLKPDAAPSIKVNP